MNPHHALRGLRIGCVQYLNAQPLIRSWVGPVIFAHPSSLARRLAAGELDVALVPSFELFRMPGYRIADGVSISSRGPVYSVFLAYRGELSEVKEVSLDPASLTSSHLLRCVLSVLHGVRPAYLPGGEGADARLLIGNQAIDFRREAGTKWQFLDLGEEWTVATGLPFVYALWLMRPGLGDCARVADALRLLKREGLMMRQEICASQALYDAAFCKRYLGEYIRFDLGPDEKAGLGRFCELLVELRMLPQSERTFDFV